MLRFAGHRLFWSIPVLLIASVLVFVAIKATTDPGAIRAPGVRAEDIERYREAPRPQRQRAVAVHELVRQLHHR